MRTTLSLDDDVAALLDRVLQSRKAGLKQVVNEALGQGLRQMIEPPKRRAPYRTRPVSLGRCLVGSLDDVSKAMAIAEGEASANAGRH
jgi:predicted transcriptional regulator